jgi:hypothetical protein
MPPAAGISLKILARVRHSIAAAAVSWMIDNSELTECKRLLLLLQAGRWLLNTVGLIEDNDEGELSGVPEFPVAVRTQLLVGEASYAIQEQPSYAAAFARTEDAVEDVLVQVR